MEKDLVEPTDMRIFVIADAMEKGFGIEKIHELTKIDHWFLYKLKNIVDVKNDLMAINNLNLKVVDKVREAKILGFSDFQLARLLLGRKVEDMEAGLLQVRHFRKKYGILPVVKQIDTLAAEYPAQTNYLYLTYSGTEHDLDYSTNTNNSVIVLNISLIVFP